MHPYYLAIFPVTALTVAGYVTLHFALASQGKMRTAGKILSGWVFLLAVAVLAAAILCPQFRPGPGMMSMHRHMHMMGHGMDGDMDDDASPAPPPAAEPAAPAAPTPPAAAPQN